MTDQVQDQRYVQAVPCKMPAAFTSNSGSNSSVSVYDIQGFSNATDVLFRTHGEKRKKKNIRRYVIHMRSQTKNTEPKIDTRSLPLWRACGVGQGDGHTAVLWRADPSVAWFCQAYTSDVV